MKAKAPTVTLFGSNSGNNVGDAAIASAIFDTLSKELPGVSFLVPTTKPSFINSTYGRRYRVKAFNILPLNGALRFLGLPSLWCLWRSDVALICDGIIFGKKLFNPAFNMLITLAPLVLFAKLFKCKLVCYSTGIGPFPNGRGRRLARFLIQNCDLIMMREAESKRLAQELGVKKPIELTGDAAFLNPVSPKGKADAISEDKGIARDGNLLGINITRYADSWLNESGKSADPNELADTVAEGVSIALSSIQDGLKPVVFCTHPMDLPVARRLSERLKAPLISNSEFLSHDLQAVMRMCSLFVGMRFHSLVLASAVDVPVVALVYAPKVRGLLECFHSPEYALTLAGLEPSVLAETLARAWAERKSLLERQGAVVRRFRAGALQAARLVKERFFPDIPGAKAASLDPNETSPRFREANAS